MNRLLITALAITLAAAAVMAAEPARLWAVETNQGWCAYRAKAAFDAAAQAEGVLSIAELTRPADGRLDIVAEAYSQAGDWRMTDRYRFAPNGEGTMSRNGVLLSTVARLDAEYRLAGGKAVRTKLHHRHLENEGPPADGWVPEISIKTTPRGFAFWPLVEAMEAQPSKARLCRKA